MGPDSLAHDQNVVLPECQDAMALHLHMKNRRCKNVRAHTARRGRSDPGIAPRKGGLLLPTLLLATNSFFISLKLRIQDVCIYGFKKRKLFFSYFSTKISQVKSGSEQVLEATFFPGYDSRENHEP